MQPPQKIAVAGATGRLGRHLVDVLTEQGHDVVPIARSLGVDVITGEGLDAALAGVSVVIDAASSPTPDEAESVAFFTASARNLQAAGQRAGVQRIVVVSIIGIDLHTGGYAVGKVAQEKGMRGGPVPVRIVRATQFHEFVEQLLGWGRQGDISYVWKMRTQLVAARSVAEVVVDVATAADFDGPTVEVAGPREERLVDAATLLAGRRGEPLKVEEVVYVDDPAHTVYADGGLLPGPDAILTGPAFEDWLDNQA